MSTPLLEQPTKASSAQLLSQRQGWQYRCGVASRVLAAACGGYVVATVGSVCLSRMFGLPPAEAVMTGLLISFPVYAAAILWCFAARTASRAWSGLVVAVLVAGTLAWVLGPGSAAP